MTNHTDELTNTVSNETVKRVKSSDINIKSIFENSHFSDKYQPVANQSAPRAKRDNSSSPSSKKSYVFLQLVSDRSGQSVIMLALFLLILSFQFDNKLWLIPAGLLVLMIRAISYKMFSQQNILNHRNVRTTVRQVVKEEGLIGFVYFALCFLVSWPPSIIEVVLCLVANLVVQGAITAILKELVLNEPNSRLSWPKNRQQSIIIVGTAETAQKLADNIIDHSELATRVDGFVDFKRTGNYRYRDIPLLGHPDQIETIIGEKQVDLLLMALEPDQIPLAQKLFHSVETMGIPIGLACDWYKTEISRPNSPKIGNIPVTIFHSAPENRVMLTIKTTFDRILAVFGLVIISPIMFITSFIIKLESKGPVFFKQTRSGTNGKPFEMFKFRTMCNDAEDKKEKLMKQNEMSGPVFKIGSDPRITGVGRYLRKYSVDEIPQLINIARGEMSLVGPRPPLPQEVAGMKPWQRRKLSVKPGVTCIWQVSGRNAIDFEEWMKLDLEYIDNWSMWNDAKLVARTIPTVIKGTGT